MIRVNLIEDLVLKQINDTYQAMSDDEKKVYDKAVKKEAKKRRNEYRYKAELEKKNTIQKLGKNGKPKKKDDAIPRHIERSFTTPARLMPMSIEQITVRTGKGE